MNGRSVRLLPQQDWARWVQWIGSALIIPLAFAFGLWIMRVEVWRAANDANRYTVHDARADQSSHANVHNMLPPDIWRERILRSEEKLERLEPRLARIETMIQMWLEREGIRVPPKAGE